MIVEKSALPSLYFTIALDSVTALTFILITSQCYFYWQRYSLYRHVASMQKIECHEVALKGEGQESAFYAKNTDIAFETRR